jgi:hypothetical protein
VGKIKRMILTENARPYSGSGIRLQVIEKYRINAIMVALSTGK